MKCTYCNADTSVEMHKADCPMNNVLNATLTNQLKAPLEDEIVEMCERLSAFLVEKNRAYGNSAADPVDVFSTGLSPLQKIDVRIDDKLSRLQRGGEYEGDDTIKDLTGYLILRMIVAEKEGPLR